MYVYVHVYIYIYIHIHMYVCVHVYTGCTCVFMFIHRYMCIFTCMRTDAVIYTQKYRYTHTHTHTYIYIYYTTGHSVLVGFSGSRALNCDLGTSLDPRYQNPDLQPKPKASQSGVYYMGRNN